MSEKLKPCPFCNKIPKVEKEDGYFLISCLNDDCVTVSPIRIEKINKRLAIQAWNHRPEVDRLREALKYIAEKEWTKDTQEPSKWITELTTVAKQVLEDTA